MSTLGIPSTFSPARPTPPTLVGTTLDLGTRRVPLHSGALHYWRVPRAAWRRALLAVRDLGLGIVETYIPWGVHEVDGKLDFGEIDPQRDVGGFLEEAAAAGLHVIVRPGPHINAELTGFGLPDRVLLDPECMARSPRGRPVVQPYPPRMFPIPSYASERFHAEVGRWFDAVGEVVAPHVWPRGNVVLVQVDNEATYYFRNGPFDQDYHPDAVALFREFLRDKYGSLAALGEAHRATYDDWSVVAPPTAFTARRLEDSVGALDWMEFHEWLIPHALRRMRARLAAAGLGDLPTLHNVALGEIGLPLSVPRLADTVSLVGLDYYHPARDFRAVKRRTSFLAGTVPFPYSPELGVGAPPWFTPLGEHDSLSTALTAFAFGLRGANLYMAVDRDRWYGAPIDAEGTPRAGAAVWSRLFGALTRTEFHTLRREAPVAIVLPNEYRRLSRATHLTGGLLSPSALEAIGGTPVDGCSEEPLGAKGPIQVLWWKAVARVTDALTEAQIPFVLVDSDADLTDLARFRLVYSPTFEFVAPHRWQALVDAVGRGTDVIVGPALPTMDERMRPYDPPHADRMRVALFDTDSDACRAVEAWTEARRVTPAYRATPAPVETAAHVDRDGTLRVLFVMNPSKRALDATVEVPRHVVLEDVLTGQRFAGDTHLALRMLPLSTRMLEVVRESSEGSAGASSPEATDDVAGVAVPAPRRAQPPRRAKVATRKRALGSRKRATPDAAGAKARKAAGKASAKQRPAAKATAKPKAPVKAVSTEKATGRSKGASAPLATRAGTSKGRSRRTPAGRKK